MFWKAKLQTLYLTDSSNNNHYPWLRASYVLSPKLCTYEYCLYYSPYGTTQLVLFPSKLWNIKQVTQGYPASDGPEEFEPRAVCLFPEHHLLETTAKSTINLSSQESGSFLYIQVSTPVSRARGWGHSGIQATSGQASFLFWWLRSWEHICRDQGRNQVLYRAS